jgi:RES domain-containing protein
LRVWRLATRRHSAFDGEGARLAGGRWNRRGTALVYTSDSLALAALEYLVNVDPDTAPDDLVAVAALVPDTLAIKRVAPDELPKNWRTFPAPSELAALGTKWAEALETAILQVPSAVVPQESNVILNPRHPDFAKVAMSAPVPFSFDARVWKKKR